MTEDGSVPYKRYVAICLMLIQMQTRKIHVQIIIGLGMMFGAGVSSYISRQLGKGDNEQANKTVSTALLSDRI